MQDYAIVTTADTADLDRQDATARGALALETARDTIRDGKLSADMAQALASARVTIETTGSALRRKNYAAAIRQFVAFREADGAPLDNGQIQRWKQTLIDGGYMPNTINAKLTAVRALLAAAALAARQPDNMTILRNMAAVKNVKQGDDLTKKWLTSKRYTIDQIRGILKSIDTTGVHGARLAALAALAFGTGLRISEIASLTVREAVLYSDKGLPVVFVSHGKFGKSRAVPLPAWVKVHLQTWIDRAEITPLLEPDSALFRAFYKGGKVRSAGAKARALQTELKALGIEAHDARRTFARLCKESGMTYDQIRRLLGHESVTTTERYIGRFELSADDMPQWTV